MHNLRYLPKFPFQRDQKIFKSCLFRTEMCKLSNVIIIKACFNKWSWNCQKLNGDIDWNWKLFFSVNIRVKLSLEPLQISIPDTVKFRLLVLYRFFLQNIDFRNFNKPCPKQTIYPILSSRNCSQKRRSNDWFEVIVIDKFTKKWLALIRVASSCWHLHFSSYNVCYKLVGFS